MGNSVYYFRINDACKKIVLLITFQSEFLHFFTFPVFEIKIGKKPTLQQFLSKLVEISTWYYVFLQVNSLREKCPYTEFFWSIFFCIRLCKSPYSVRIQENADQKNSVFGHFSRSDYVYRFITDSWKGLLKFLKCKPFQQLNLHSSAL